MIKITRFQKMHSGKYVVYGVSNTANNNVTYRLEFVRHNNSLVDDGDRKETDLTPDGSGRGLLSFEVELTRGLYKLFVTKYISVEPKQVDESSRYEYPEAIYIGEKQIVNVRKDNDQYYGSNGVKVHIESKEILKTGYIKYKIHKKNNTYIYTVPFNPNSTSTEFFVLGVETENIEVYSDNISFEINKIG